MTADTSNIPSVSYHIISYSHVSSSYCWLDTTLLKKKITASRSQPPVTKNRLMTLWPSLVAQLPHRARRGSPSLLPRAGAWRCYPSCNSAAAVAAPGPWLPRKPLGRMFPRNKWAICKNSRRKMPNLCGLC